MKTFFKILFITASLQFAGFVFTFFFDGLLYNSGSSTIAPIFVGLFFLLLSVICGFVLPVKWYKSTPKKILSILLLPTNYTWLLIGFAVIKFVRTILSILENIPSNFG